MTRRRHTPDQIIRKLAEGNKLLAGGTGLDEVCRHLQIADSNWHLGPLIESMRGPDALLLPRALWRFTSLTCGDSPAVATCALARDFENTPRQGVHE